MNRLQDPLVNWNFISTDALGAPLGDNHFFVPQMIGETGGQAYQHLQNGIAAENSPAATANNTNNSRNNTIATISPNPPNPRPHACPNCTRLFTTTKDRDRHLRTVHHQATPGGDTWVCHQSKCKRKGKPFSRHDNYLKHLREVHGSPRSVALEESSEVTAVSDDDDDDDDDGGEPSPVAAVVGEGLCRKGKRKADDDDNDDDDQEEEEGGLDDLSREGLLQVVLQMGRKCRKLEDEIRVQRRRRRHELREDMWLRLLSVRMGKDLG